MKLLAGNRDPDKEFSYQDLQTLTDDFSQQNFIGRTQFGKLYRGKIPQGWRQGLEAGDVTVKVWQDTQLRIIDDVMIFYSPHDETRARWAFDFGVSSGHPFKQCSCIAAELDWLHRIRAALGLARLLEFLHSQQPSYLLRNLSAAHIILDQGYNPILVDFAMLVGGAFGDRRLAGSGIPWGSYGYTEMNLAVTGEWQEGSDVFSFGVVLLELMRRTPVDSFRGFKKDGASFLYDAAQASYKVAKSKSHLANVDFVHRIFKGDPFYYSEDGPKITELVLRCLEDEYSDRPSSVEVIRNLLSRQMKKSRVSSIEENKFINSVVEESLLRVLEAPFSVRESMASYADSHILAAEWSSDEDDVGVGNSDWTLEWPLFLLELQLRLLQRRWRRQLEQRQQRLDSGVDGGDRSKAHDRDSGMMGSVIEIENSRMMG
ncbi:hypothetical protein RJ640_025542 [Escallonia rubra]|uniref:Protein kinase domain-containing protein n=1 Tax=Escallonia rubra TaxID=112253 RepID=A0AA88U8L3_9ASTE|nr:hypothetical protein RJ640_025542 [Escallonia rubra]